MNDKVIEFYIQVADELAHGRDWCTSGVDGPLRRFAALVASAEREACIGEVLAYSGIHFFDAAQIAAAIRARGNT